MDVQDGGRAPAVERGAPHAAAVKPKPYAEPYPNPPYSARWNPAGLQKVDVQDGGRAPAVERGAPPAAARRFCRLPAAAGAVLLPAP